MSKYVGYAKWIIQEVSKPTVYAKTSWHTHQAPSGIHKSPLGLLCMPTLIGIHSGPKGMLCMPSGIDSRLRGLLSMPLGVGIHNKTRGLLCMPLGCLRRREYDPSF
jgi:hypothetical protein